MGSQAWAVKLTEFWECQSNYSTELQALPNDIDE
jgi:hypothetical protein